MAATSMPWPATPSGTIAATGVARVKGRVFLTAGDGGQVKVDKPVKATEADGRGGKITVDGGQVDVAGRLDASGTVGGEVRITSNIATVFSGEVLAFGDGSAGSWRVCRGFGRASDLWRQRSTPVAAQS